MSAMFAIPQQVCACKVLMAIAYGHDGVMLRLWFIGGYKWSDEAGVV